MQPHSEFLPGRGGGGGGGGVTKMSSFSPPPLKKDECDICIAGEEGGNGDVSCFCSCVQ